MAAVGFSRPLSRTKKSEAKENLFRTRKRIIKHLILNFLRTEGYKNTAELFQNEADIQNDFQLCDNVDLEIILQEYCNYYLLKFNKQPIFVKRLEDPTKVPAAKIQTQRRPPTVNNQQKEPEKLESNLHLPIVVKQISKSNHSSQEKIQPKSRLPEFLALQTQEKKEIAETLYNEMVTETGGKVRWNDIIGLEDAKSLLMESVIYPLKRPELFGGLLKPWKGILLHGPPGGGKTMLAKAVAFESDCTFFNVSPNTIINKWRGESEKIVKLLFHMAHFMAPSIIFVDELDSVASTRGGDSEHEASRRLKSQILTEIDGMETREGSVFVLANTNLPWLIDTAMLRRLEKRIHVPLPDLQTREYMLKTFMTHSTIQLDKNVDFSYLADITDGYSGSDLRIVCKESLMGCLRKVLSNVKDFAVLNESTKPEYRIKQQDLVTAIRKTKPVSKELIEKHKYWQGNMGSS